MDKNQQPVTINKWFGGMSWDERIGQSDQSGSSMSFFDGTNIDHRSDSKFVTLSQRPQTLASLGASSTYWSVVATVGYNGYLAAVTSNGYVFGNNDSLSSYVASANVGNVITYGGYAIVFKTNGKIDRWALTSTNDTGASLANVDYGDVGVSLVDNSVVIAQNAGYALLWNGDAVYSIDLTTGTGYVGIPVLTIDYGYKIRAITSIGEYYYVYATNGQDSYQYFWTGGTLATGAKLQKVPWIGRPIVNVVNFNNVDYPVTGNNFSRAFNVVNAYQPQMMYQTRNTVQDIYRNRFFLGQQDAQLPVYPNSFTVYRNLLYIAAPGAIYTYGHFNNGFPDSFVRSYSFNGDAPTCIRQFGDYLYYFYVNSGTLHKAYLNLNSLQNYSRDPGTVIMNPILDGLYSNLMEFSKVRIGFDVPSDKCCVNVYVKYDNDAYATNFYVSNLSGTAPSVWSVYSDGSATYTVVDSTYLNALQGYGIIHCEKTLSQVTLDQVNQLNVTGTLTKVSGTGPSSMSFYRKLDGMELILRGTYATKQYGDVTRIVHRAMEQPSEVCSQVTLAIDLVSQDWTQTPALWDLVAMYDQNIDNDL